MIGQAATEHSLGVWWTGIDDHRLIGSDLRPPTVLSAVEQQRWHALRHPDDRMRFTAGALMVREIAEQLLSVPRAVVSVDRRCPDCGRDHDRPKVAGLELSVAHSGPVISVAWSVDLQVGIDLEEPARAAEVAQAADLVLSGQEVQRWGGHAPDAEALLRLWVGKEAVLKATGRGLRVPMTALTLPDAGSGTVVLPPEHFPDGGRINLQPLIVADMVCAIAYSAAPTSAELPSPPLPSIPLPSVPVQRW